MHIDNTNRFNTRRWILIALINFCLVALAGVTLRYKINFPLPSVNQKHLLHGHSNFAFTGWVTIILMTLLVYYLQQQKITANLRKYVWLIGMNCLCAYGMLASFTVEGYDVISITFSSVSILLSYVFIVVYWKDLNKVNDASFATAWFKAALIIWAISSLGAISLAYLMFNNILIQDLYFASLYFFLHFQYNGWFLFACFGFLCHSLYKRGYLSTIPIQKKLFWVLIITVLPAYILSIIWLKIPAILFWFGNIAGVLQIFVLIYFMMLVPRIKVHHPHNFSQTTRAFWIMASIAFILKICLQMLSIIPYLSKFAFGYRPVIIGYLHLSFLGIISFFLLGYIDHILRQMNRKISVAGAFIFVAGVLMQELILMFQGLEAIEVEPLPFANRALFYCAVAIFAGLVWITWSINKLYPGLETQHKIKETAA